MDAMLCEEQKNQLIVTQVQAFFTSLNVQTQSVMSTLLRKERPPVVLRNTCVALWTIHT